MNETSFDLLGSLRSEVDLFRFGRVGFNFPFGKILENSYEWFPQPFTANFTVVL